MSQNNFLTATVNDLIMGRFGATTGAAIIAAIQECLQKNPTLAGIPLIDCAVDKLKDQDYSKNAQKEIFDFLVQFVIVG
jgi:hypothetical protein